MQRIILFKGRKFLAANEKVPVIKNHIPWKQAKRISALPENN